MSAKRLIAWALLAVAALVMLCCLAFAFGGFDPKGTGSLAIAAFVLALVGWMLGDF
jgi:hypothetical protein